MSSIFDDEFGDKVQPREGFVYPNPGDKITALKDYETHASKGERFVRAGDVGTVTGIRKPGSFKDDPGYIGLVVHFERVAKSYSCGFVIRWDKASDPAAFSIAPPTPEELQAAAEQRRLEEEKWRERDKRLSDPYGDKAEPRGGFVYPQPGDKIVAVKDYKTAAGGADGTVRAGDEGTVTGLRLPGSFKDESGYIGLIVEFERVKKSYSGGFVVRWDDVSDPNQFSIPASEQKAVQRDEQIYAAAQTGTGEAFQAPKPLRFKNKFFATGI